VRVRIVRFLKGEIDGVPLANFRVDQTYEVGTTLASYLLAVGAAVPVIDEGSAVVDFFDLPARRGKATTRKRKR
jgi:hypothetical protein